MDLREKLERNAEPGLAGTRRTGGQLFSFLPHKAKSNSGSSHQRQPGMAHEKLLVRG